jgi:hypothetical protein
MSASRSSTMRRGSVLMPQLYSDDIDRRSGVGGRYGIPGQRRGPSAHGR